MTLVIADNAPLKAFNSFGVTAHARRLVHLTDARDLDRALDALCHEPARLVLGAGSNVLFAGDFEGTVLRMETVGCALAGEEDGDPVACAAAGQDWDGFVRWTLAQGLAGLENLAMIPGTVGASPIQNIGAYGLEMRERFHSLGAVRIADGTRREFSPTECAFGYRDSLFRHSPGQWLITEVRFKLSRGAAPRTGYADLRDELSRRGTGAAPSANEIADAVRTVRARKLPDPKVLGNAGSFFKNPHVDPALASELAERHPGLPVWPEGERAKLSAAWMIECCGWKGHRDGDAGVHASHALVLVNHGTASGAQILALAARIRASVLERFGVTLQIEPVVIAA